MEINTFFPIIDKQVVFSKQIKGRKKKLKQLKKKKKKGLKRKVIKYINK